MKALALAERAALGSLLLDPGRLRSVEGWLRAADFADPWHRDVYAVLRERRTERAATGPVEVGRALLDRLGPTRAELARIPDLLRAVPADPDPRAYAAMVVDAALRREIAGCGVLLRAGALAAAGNGSGEPMTATARTVDALLDAAEHRWRCATGAISGVPGRSDAPLREAETAVPLAADRFVQAQPVPDRATVAEHEADLIGVLIAKPESLPPLVDWLRVAQLTESAWRPVLSALLRLHERGERIDVVTVVWETQRTSAIHGRGPDAPAVLARAEAAMSANPAYRVRVVAADHLRIAAEGAAAGLETAAAAPGLDINDLVRHGRDVTAALRWTAEPLGVFTADQRRGAAIHRLPVPQTPPTGRAGLEAG